MDWTWMGEPSPLIKLNLKELVETVMVTVMIVIADPVVTVAVTMAVVVRHVEVVVVGIATSVANLGTLLESAQMGTVGEVTDTVAENPEMIGMVVVVVMDLTVAATDLTVVMTVLTVAVIDLTGVVTDLTGVVTDILVVAEMVVTVVTVLVPIDGLDLDKCVSSRYENPICYRRCVLPLCLKLSDHVFEL
jgi:hypothetical protein